MPCPKTMLPRLAITNELKERKNRLSKTDSRHIAKPSAAAIPIQITRVESFELEILAVRPGSRLA